MDPLTQGLLGAALPLSVAKREQLRTAALIGWLGGMAPDMDVFIRSQADPLLAIQYHRHFTHALLFVPVGGLIVATVLYPFLKKRVSFKQAWLFAFLGYLTHAPLDACTSYGTRLLWPFSDLRVAWDNIAVVDPLFTLPLAFCVVLSIVRRSNPAARIGMALSIVILFFGVVQRERAEAALLRLAAERGHDDIHMVAKPSIMNLVLWRGIYLYDEHFYVDGVYIGFFAEPVFYEGESIRRFEIEEIYPNLSPESVLAGDIRRFAHFSADYLAMHPKRDNFLCDIRYALLPNSVEPLWGIVIDPDKPEKHVTFENSREVTEEKKSLFWTMLWGKPLNQIK